MRLIILEKKLNFFEKFFLEIIRNKKDIFIDPFNNNLNYLKFKKIDSINFSDDLSRIISKSNNSLKIKFKQEIYRFPELAKMKISEINFSDKYWKIFFFKKFLNNFIKKRKVTKVFLISNYDFMLFRALNVSHKKNLSTHIKYLKFFLSFINYLKIFYIFFNNLSIELLNSLILKRKKFTTRSKILLIANFPRDWDLSTSSYKFLGKQTKLFSTLISISRTNSNILKYFKFLKIPKNFFILESYFDVFDITKIYFLSLLNIFKNYIKIKRSCKNIGLGFYSNEILLTYNLIERSKNIVLQLAIKKFLKENKGFTKSFIPMFEFVESRIYSNVLKTNKIKTLSFQHSVVMTIHQSRFFSANSALKSIKPEFIPNLVYVEGDIASRELKYNKIKSTIVGAVRLKNYKNFKIPKFASKSNRNILYIDELYDNQNLMSLLDFINQEEKKFNFFIRLHPANYEKLSKKIINFESKNKNIFLDKSKTIEEAIYKNKIGFCISSSCTSFLDLIKKRQPCFLLKKNNLFLNTPYKFKYKQLFINDFFEINKKILLFKKQKMPPEKYIKKYIKIMGLEAEKKVKELL